MAKKNMIELFDTFPVSFKANDLKKEVILNDAKEEIKSGYSLICEVNATHAGTLINNRIYPPENMKRGIRSWTSPYKKPVLTNHDDTKDPIGRVISGKYLQTELGMSGKDWKPILRESEGYGYQRLTVKITDAEAIKKILDGRYQTVSVRMSTDHCTCSICGCDWSGGDGPCEHTPGTKYEGKLAYMTTGDLSYRELSFVNIPADEYAGVKEAVIADQKNTAEMNLYANNDSDKVLSNLDSGDNLYALLDSDEEGSDDVVSYLLDKSSKATTINKEDDVKLTDLTKDFLKDLDAVKELINEAVDKANAECEINAEKIKKDYDEQIELLSDAKNKPATNEKENEKKLKGSHEEQEKEVNEEDEKKKKAKKDEEEEDAKKKKKDGPGHSEKGSGGGTEKEKLSGGKETDPEPEDGKDCTCGMDDGKHTKACPMYKADEEEDEYEIGEDGKKVKKPKKGAPVPKELPENKGKGKSGGVKHGEGNLSPIQEEPHEHGGDSQEMANKAKELEDTSIKLLDENVKINSELHRMVAERLYDLKKTLRKPDVISVRSQEDRDKKVEELAQRSIDSLKDQIKDLLIEQENALTTGLEGDTVQSTAISHIDMTNEVMDNKKKVREGKHETLTRLFPKSA